MNHYVAHSTPGLLRLERLAGSHAALEAQIIETHKLLAPEVVEAAAYLKRTADAHPSACCPKCTEGLAERDALRTLVADLAAALREADKDKSIWSHVGYGGESNWIHVNRYVIAPLLARADKVKP